MSKITDYEELDLAASDDFLVIVDTHDLTMSPYGTTKKIRSGNLGVSTSGNNSWTGSNTFNGEIIVNTPVNPNDAANKSYVDNHSGSGSVTSVTAGDGSIVISGIVTAPILETGTLDLIASLHPAASAWSNNNKKITNVANGTASSDVAAFGQIPVIDTTASDLQPIGIANQGATGKVSDAGHVHPYEPWQFVVTGATGNGKIVVDGAMSSSSNTNVLTCTTSTPFSSGDVGKYVIVNGAGAVSGESLIATITGFTDSGHVILSANAGQTVSGATVCFGTDDTASIQSAINSAVSYAQAHGLYAEVIIPPAPSMFYMIAGSLVTGGSTHGNAQLTLPVITTTTGKVTLVIKGTSDASSIAHWQQLPTLLTGTTLISTGVFSNSTNQSNSINANGNPCIIGGPAQPAGYGTTGTLFSNMCVVLDGIRLVVPLSMNGYAYCGFDFSGVAEARLVTGGCDSTATYATEWSGHNMGAAGFNFGGLMPAGGNNDRNPINEWSVGGGFVYGMMLTEHCNSERIRILYCWTALAISGSYWSAGNVHAVHIGQASIEQCSNVIKIFGSGANGVGPYIDIDQLDWEGSSTINLIDDGSNGLANARGTINITGFVPTGVNINGAAQSSSNQTGLRIIFNSNPPGPVASPSSAPGNNSAWFNPYYHDAWITLSATTITAVKIDSTTQAIPSGATTYAFFLPSGHSYTPTYTGTLTHTVSLL